MTGNRSAAIRSVLREGPSTSEEVAATLEITTRSAQIGLWVLKDQGHVRAAGSVPRPGFRGGPARLYELTERAPADR
jgi:predicted ArsR family transcriptional regulator